MKEFFDFFKDMNMDYNIVNYDKGAMVFVENEVCTSFFLILSGSIQIKRISPEGNILMITEFKAGDPIGETLIFGSKNTFPMSVFAKTDTSILKASRDTILHMCQNNLEFLSKFLETISDKSLALSQKLTQVDFKTIRQMICGFLLQEYYSQGSLKIKLNMNKTELADQMGVLRPSLYRELNNLRDEKILDYDRNYIYIEDLKKVEHISTMEK